MVDGGYPLSEQSNMTHITKQGWLEEDDGLEGDKFNHQTHAASMKQPLGGSTNSLTLDDDSVEEVNPHLHHSSITMPHKDPTSEVEKPNEDPATGKRKEPPHHGNGPTHAHALHVGKSYTTTTFIEIPWSEKKHEREKKEGAT